MRCVCIGRPRRRPKSAARFGATAVLAGLTMAAGLLPPVTRAQSPPDRYALLIGGLGGGAEQTELFGGYLLATRRALVETFGFDSQHVTVLAEPALSDRAFVNGVSTEDNIRAAFQRLSGELESSDHVYVVLFGHGNSDDKASYLNIPRRDLSDADYAGLLDGLDAGRIVLINTASSSAPFVERISAEGRVVITATRTASQRNETVFPGYFVEALTSPSADLDRDGDLSVGEVFRFASEATERYFEDASLLATEHALLEDTGDGVGYQAAELEAGAEGNLAAATWLRRRTLALDGLAPAARAEVAGLLARRDELGEEIAAVKAQKSELDLDDYYARLEVLFVELARLEDSVEVNRR